LISSGVQCYIAVLSNPPVLWPTQARSLFMLADEH